MSDEHQVWGGSLAVGEGASTARSIRKLGKHLRLTEGDGDVEKGVETVIGCRDIIYTVTDMHVPPQDLC